MLMEPQVRSIPVDAIQVLNPRGRNQRVFQDLVESIRVQGLKKPITVRARPEASERSAYDLICGQGRLEAYRALGAAEIPAVVVQAELADCYVMSLIENVARRRIAPVEQLREIQRLKDQGQAIAEIARRLGLSLPYTVAMDQLLQHGEERLVDAVERGLIPVTAAIELARSRDADIQETVLLAHQEQKLSTRQVIALRRLLQERQALGKAYNRPGKPLSKVTTRPLAETLLKAYRKETDRQKAMIRRAEYAHARMTFLVGAMAELLRDADFVALLRQHGLDALPAPLLARMPVAGPGP
ncbi:MAG: ParB/RepB/Spo0J family partition protein [Alphaproteobacteria bacterium]|nr:ParB/RepB/Spo0J family partition protein [Alphaproteobacteria bacterium]